MNRDGNLLKKDFKKNRKENTLSTKKVGFKKNDNGQDKRRKETENVN